MSDRVSADGCMVERRLSTINLQWYWVKWVPINKTSDGSVFREGPQKSFSLNKLYGLLTCALKFGDDRSLDVLCARNFGEKSHLRKICGLTHDNYYQIVHNFNCGYPGNEMVYVTFSVGTLGFFLTVFQLFRWFCLSMLISQK